MATALPYHPLRAAAVNRSARHDTRPASFRTRVDDLAGDRAMAGAARGGRRRGWQGATIPPHREKPSSEPSAMPFRVREPSPLEISHGIRKGPLSRRILRRHAPCTPAPKAASRPRSAFFARQPPRKTAVGVGAILHPSGVHHEQKRQPGEAGRCPGITSVTPPSVPFVSPQASSGFPTR